MKWFNVSCNKTRSIIPAQKWLFDKYVGIEPIYLDVKDNPIENWGKKVASMLPNDKYIIFGLDDYLPIDKIDKQKLNHALEVVKMEKLERFELGWGASKKKHFVESRCFMGYDDVNGMGHDYLAYGKETPYKVSCQFSIWETEALKRELNRTTTPWQFEIYGQAKAGCFKEPVLRWIEESALSGRQPNKVNVLGLRPDDVKSLQELEYLGNNIIYGWKGATELPTDKGGNKYKRFYEI